MWYVGVDMGWRSSVVAVASEDGALIRPRRFGNDQPAAMVEFVSRYKPFQAVIEATGTYRWMYDLLSEQGKVVLAHPYRLRAIWSARAKTDKLDARVLAELLRGGLIPEAYVPPTSYQRLRDFTRARARLVRARTTVMNQVRAMLAATNLQCPFGHPLGPRGLQWLAAVPFHAAQGIVRDEYVERIRHFGRMLQTIDRHLECAAVEFPQAHALTGLAGFGLYSALLVVAELGEPWRFRQAAQVAAYAGLTPRVYQSGQRDFHGGISRQGSPWLRWILVEAAYKVTRRDEPLRRFYERVRRRRGRQAARVAVARKLAEICWKRLMRWHEAQNTSCLVSKRDSTGKEMAGSRSTLMRGHSLRHRVAD